MNKLRTHLTVFLVAVVFAAGAYAVVKAMVYVNRAYFGGW